MSDNPRDNQQCDPDQSGSCGQPGGSCPSCGGGKLLLLLLAGLVVAYFVTNRPTLAPAEPSAVDWVSDYDQALATAAENEQPVLLAFKASWCGPCRVMDNEVFAKEAAAGALSDWVPVAVDIDEQGKLADKYRVSSVPTFVVLSPSGQEIARTSGGMSLQQFAQFLASAEGQLNLSTAKVE